MNKYITMSIVLLSGLFSHSIYSNDSNTIQEQTLQERIVHVSKQLESSPFGNQSSVDRKWALQIINNSNIIEGISCDQFFSPLILQNSNYKDIYMQQQIISSAAYWIQHPGTPKVGDGALPWVEAGIRGMLNVYAAIKKATDVNNDYLEALNDLNNRGHLTRYIEDGWIICQHESHLTTGGKP